MTLSKAWKKIALRGAAPLFLALPFIAVIGGGTTANAQSSNAEQIMRLRGVLLSEITTQTPEARQDFAAALGDYWQNLRDTVPPLSEEDKQWLLDNADTVAAEEGEIDPRYARFRLLRRSEVCLQYLTNAQQVYADTPVTMAEASAWLGILECHEDDGNTQRFMSVPGVTDAETAPTIVPTHDIRLFVIDRVLRGLLSPA